MSEEVEIKCPLCSKDIDTFCDNDCGTFHCCNREFYQEENKIIIGHNPKCGEDDEIIDDDFIDEIHSSI